MAERILQLILKSLHRSRVSEGWHLILSGVEINQTRDEIGKTHLERTANLEKYKYVCSESKDASEDKPSRSEEDFLDEDVLETIASLGYQLEDVIRLIEEEDEEMISLYMRLLEENQNHLKAIYPSYMKSKVSDWKNYAFLLASPENSEVRSRREKSRNNRVLSYSPKRHKQHYRDSKSSLPRSKEPNPLRFVFYPKQDRS